MYFQDYCNTEVVLSWVKKMLLPELQVGQIVIWDTGSAYSGRASFHKSLDFSELIASAGCRLVYVPTYSPDLNPIEQWWSVLKVRIRRLRKWVKLTIGEALEHILKKNH